MFPKWRGKQVLMRDENGLEKCVACGLCAVACPADAIYLEAAENDGTVQAGPRYAKVYQIHKTRCIFCGYCEEACPVSAIFMGKDYELAVYSNKDFIWDKADLLVPAPRRRNDDRSASSGVFGALGDIHGAFDAARAIVARHPEVPFWLCVGDIADEHGRYEPLGARVYWIHGNNDNFDAIAAGDLPADLHHIAERDCRPKSPDQGRPRWRAGRRPRAARSRRRGTRRRRRPAAPVEGVFRPRRSTDASATTSAATSCAKRSRRARRCAASTSS